MGATPKLVSQTEHTIERGIPMPAVRRNHKYPFAEMSVGDSVSFPAALAENAKGAAYAYGKKNGKEFVHQRSATDGSIRIWRRR